MNGVYYNEFDPFAAAWLRQLIKDGLLPDGDVDERSIAEVEAVDVRGYRACHWFAGIGGWPLALQLAAPGIDFCGWTGSCPCQDFSQVGKRKGIGAARDLWPVFFRIIRECRPQCVFGEQVSAAIRHGWLDRLQADMEAEGYTVGACVLGAHSAGADHQRQRLYWVAHRERARLQGHARDRGAAAQSGRGQDADRHAARSGGAVWDHWRDSITIECRDGKRRRVPAEPALFPLAHGLPNRVGLLRGAGNAICVQTAALFVRAFLEAEGSVNR